MRAGPNHVNIVLNGSPGCCGCGSTPLTAGLVRQRPHVLMGMPRTGPEVPEETIPYNTWLRSGSGGTCGLPPQLSGRVDPAVWADFVRNIGVLQQMQKTCIHVPVLQLQRGGPEGRAHCTGAELRSQAGRSGVRQAGLSLSAMGDVDGRRRQPNGRKLGEPIVRLPPRRIPPGADAGADEHAWPGAVHGATGSYHESNDAALLSPALPQRGSSITTPKKRPAAMEERCKGF